jgi:hypothetical protein
MDSSISMKDQIWFLCVCVCHHVSNVLYQVSQKHSGFSWWWTHSCPKHVEINKDTKNNMCTKLVLFTEMHGQQNVKFISGDWWLLSCISCRHPGMVYVLAGVLYVLDGSERLIWLWILCGKRCCQLCCGFVSNIGTIFFFDMTGYKLCFLWNVCSRYWFLYLPLRYPEYVLGSDAWIKRNIALLMLKQLELK